MMSALQEPPAKRLKLSTNTLYDRIPDIEQVHAECRNRLKSSFESIFEKYSHDFGGISDEIDQKTGNVVADRGHLQGMRAPGDVGLERAENARNDKSRSQEPVDDNDSEDELLGGHKVRITSSFHLVQGSSVLIGFRVPPESYLQSSKMPWSYTGHHYDRVYRLIGRTPILKSPV